VAEGRVQLGDLAITVFSGRPLTRLRAEDGADQAHVINLRDVTTRLPPRAELESIPVRMSGETARLAIKPGDVVVTARGSSVRAAVATEEHVDTLPGANLIVLRPRDTSPHLLAAYLRHPDVQAHLFQEFAGSSTLGFTVETLRQLEVRDLPMEEANLLAQMSEAVEQYALHTERAAELRRRATTEAVFDRLWPGA